MQKYTLLSGLLERETEANGRPGRGPVGGGRLSPGAGHLPRAATGLPGPPTGLRGRRKRPGHLAPGHVLGPNDLDGGVGSGRDGAGHPGLQAAKSAIPNGEVSALEIFMAKFHREIDSSARDRKKNCIFRLIGRFLYFYFPGASFT